MKRKRSRRVPNKPPPEKPSVPLRKIVRMLVALVGDSLASPTTDNHLADLGEALVQLWAVPIIQCAEHANAPYSKSRTAFHEKLNKLLDRIVDIRHERHELLSERLKRFASQLVSLLFASSSSFRSGCSADKSNIFKARVLVYRTCSRVCKCCCRRAPDWRRSVDSWLTQHWSTRAGVRTEAAKEAEEFAKAIINTPDLNIVGLPTTDDPFDQITIKYETWSQALGRLITNDLLGKTQAAAQICGREEEQGWSTEEQLARWRRSLLMGLTKANYDRFGDKTLQAWQEWLARRKLCVQQTIVYWERKSNVAKGGAEAAHLLVKGREEAAELIVCPFFVCSECRQLADSAQFLQLKYQSKQQIEHEVVRVCCRRCSLAIGSLLTNATLHFMFMQQAVLQRRIEASNVCCLFAWQQNTAPLQQLLLTAMGLRHGGRVLTQQVHMILHHLQDHPSLLQRITIHWPTIFLRCRMSLVSPTGPLPTLEFKACPKMTASRTNGLTN